VIVTFVTGRSSRRSSAYTTVLVPSYRSPSSVATSSGITRLTAPVVIRTRLSAHGNAAGWTTLRRILDGQQRVTATFRRSDGRTLHVRTATQAEPGQRELYDALGVDPHPGGVRKTVV